MKQKTSSSAQQYRSPIVEMPATPDSTIRQQQFFNSSQVGSSNYGGSSGYSSYNHRASHNESYTNGQPDYIRQLNFTDSHKGKHLLSLCELTTELTALFLYSFSSGGVDHLSSSSRAFQGGRYEEHNEEHVLPSSNLIPENDNLSENRTFRPIFHPIHTESANQQQSSQSKWPSSARDY